MKASDVQIAAEQFLEKLNRSPATVRAYRADLTHLQRWLQDSGRELDGGALEAYFAAHAWAASTQNRKQTAIERFCRWSRQHGGPDLDPTQNLERPKIPPPHPRGLRRDDIERIFAVIPARQMRDTLLFRLVFETGLRISEALNIHLDDLDLARGDEHLTVLGKGAQRRTVLLDDPRLVNALRKYLRSLDYEHGPLFQAQKNGRGGPLRYQSVQERWQGFGLAPKVGRFRVEIRLRSRVQHGTSRLPQGRADGHSGTGHLTLQLRQELKKLRLRE